MAADRTISVVVAAVIALLAGCGTDSAPADTVSKPEPDRSLYRQVNDACQALNEAVAALPAAGSQAEKVEVYGRFLNLLAGTVDDVERLSTAGSAQSRDVRLNFVAPARGFAEASATALGQLQDPQTADITAQRELAQRAFEAKQKVSDFAERSDAPRCREVLSGPTITS